MSRPADHSRDRAGVENGHALGLGLICFTLSSIVSILEAGTSG